MYDRLRELADGMDAESIDQILQPMAGDPSEEDIERREREYYRSMLEPKYVIVKEHGRYEFRARYVDMHRTLLSPDEIRQGRCDGGGFWGVDGEQKRVTLYDSSSDFGRPKNIEAAICQDGAHLLEILGKVCDKTGEEHDLSDYTITYTDAIGHRHIVEPPYNQQPEVKGSYRLYYKYRDRSIGESVGINRKKAPRQQPKDSEKKKKAKARQQKQSKKRNRKK